MGENNFVKIWGKMKYYYHANKTRLKVQVAIIALVITFVVGQAGQSFSSLLDSSKRISLNPFILIYYAWGKMFFISLALLVVLNVLLIFVITNMEDKYYDKERDFQISEHGTLGTGGFMQLEDKQKALIMDDVEKIEGPILGKDPLSQLVCSPKESLFLNGHKFICGGSGSRKTTTQAMNDLLQIIKRGESFLASDPKAEIVGMLRKLCEMEGYVVKVLNLVNLMNSDGVDFIKCLRSDDGNRDLEVENAMTLAQVIMENTTEDVTNGFWDDCQKGLLTATILYVMYDATGGTKPTLADAYNLILKKDKLELDRLFNSLSDDHPSKAQYLIYAKTDAKVRDSVVIGLMMRLQVWQGESVKKIISEDEIDLTLPAKQKCAYFLVMSDQKHTYDFISSLFFSMFFIKEVEYIDSLPTREAKVPINLIMDEFPSIGHIPDFSRKLATLRSRRIFITVIIQNYGQIIDMYDNNEWQTIVSNCDTNIYLGGNDIKETADFYTERLGEMTVISHGKRTNQKLLSVTNNNFHPQYMMNESESSRPVMTKEELMRLSLDEAIVFLKSCRPLKVEKFVYKDHPLADKIIDINATTHFPKWKREMDGLPDLADEVLYPLIIQLRAAGQMAQYLELHRNNKKYLLMDYLSEYDENTFNIYNGYLTGNNTNLPEFELPTSEEEVTPEEEELVARRAAQNVSVNTSYGDINAAIDAVREYEASHPEAVKAETNFSKVTQNEKGMRSYGPISSGNSTPAPTAPQQPSVAAGSTVNTQNQSQGKSQNRPTITDIDTSSPPQPQAQTKTQAQAQTESPPVKEREADRQRKGREQLGGEGGLKRYGPIDKKSLFAADEKLQTERIQQLQQDTSTGNEFSMGDFTASSFNNAKESKLPASDSPQIEVKSKSPNKQQEKTAASQSTAHTLGDFLASSFDKSKYTGVDAKKHNDTEATVTAPYSASSPAAAAPTNKAQKSEETEDNGLETGVKLPVTDNVSHETFGDTNTIIPSPGTEATLTKDDDDYEDFDSYGKRLLNQKYQSMLVQLPTATGEDLTAEDITGNIDSAFDSENGYIDESVVASRESVTVPKVNDNIDDVVSPLTDMPAAELPITTTPVLKSTETEGAVITTTITCDTPSTPVVEATPPTTSKSASEIKNNDKGQVKIAPTETEQQTPPSLGVKKGNFQLFDDDGTMKEGISVPETNITKTIGMGKKAVGKGLKKINPRDF